MVLDLIGLGEGVGVIGIMHEGVMDAIGRGVGTIDILGKGIGEILSPMDFEVSHAIVGGKQIEGVCPLGAKGAIGAGLAVVSESEFDGHSSACSPVEEGELDLFVAVAEVDVIGLCLPGEGISGGCGESGHALAATKCLHLL